MNTDLPSQRAVDAAADAMQSDGGTLGKAINAMHSPKLGVERSVCLNHVLEFLRDEPNNELNSLPGPVWAEILGGYFASPELEQHSPAEPPKAPGQAAVDAVMINVKREHDALMQRRLYGLDKPGYKRRLEGACAALWWVLGQRAPLSTDSTWGADLDAPKAPSFPSPTVQDMQKMCDLLRKWEMYFPSFPFLKASDPAADAQPDSMTSASSGDDLVTDSINARTSPAEPADSPEKTDGPEILRGHQPTPIWSWGPSAKDPALGRVVQTIQRERMNLLTSDQKVADRVLTRIQDPELGLDRFVRLRYAFNLLHEDGHSAAANNLARACGLSKESMVDNDKMVRLGDITDALRACPERDVHPAAEYLEQEFGGPS